MEGDISLGKSIAVELDTCHRLNNALYLLLVQVVERWVLFVDLVVCVDVVLLGGNCL